MPDARAGTRETHMIESMVVALLVAVITAAIAWAVASLIG
jgi:hypothetical protein